MNSSVKDVQDQYKDVQDQYKDILLAPVDGLETVGVASRGNGVITG